uniref:IRF tryptophan pentad repeat domain-containing protein n=1 Tax=Pavo cristatus TaxID=9049 RepID=A0A8C9EZA5_PAVCR
SNQTPTLVALTPNLVAQTSTLLALMTLTPLTLQAWAAETGKFLAGRDEPDPAKWKATLRCALNKSREFRLRYDGTRAVPPRPYKVYEVCGADGAGMGLGRARCGNMGSVGSQHPMKCLSMGWQYPMGSSDVRAPLAAPSLHCSPDCEMDPVPPWPKEHPQFSSADATIPHPNPTNPTDPAVTDLELRFHYRGRRVSALTVSHPLGCRLSHGGSLPPTLQRPDLLGHPELQQVPFPDPEGIPHDKQRRYTCTLLGAMERGLLLELGGQDLYATRLCRCKVFWDGPCAPPQDPHLDPRPNPMERERRVQVFSLQRFLDGLILFQKGQSPTPPPFEVFLCFGEEWPDHRPKEKKLITVQVVPVAARLLLELFSGELSWSADSVPLQISQPDLKDALVEQFKELHRLWQQQQHPEAGPRPPL